MPNLIVSTEKPASLVHAARNCCRGIVMQSTLGASLPVSAQRFVGTAVGAAAGAVFGTISPGNIAVFGLVVFAIGVLATAFTVDRSAFRYASITVAIVMLVPRPESLWTVAMHRFFEVSIGIGIGLAICAVWPEEEISNPPVLRAP